MKIVIAATAILSAVIMAVDLRQPYDKAVISTAWIEAGEGTGTGVFIGENLVLTASHVVEGESVILAHSPRFEGGAVVSSPTGYTRGMACTVIASDPGRDLALLRVKGTGKPMALAQGKPRQATRSLPSVAATARHCSAFPAGTSGRFTRPNILARTGSSPPAWWI